MDAGPVDQVLGALVGAKVSDAEDDVSAERNPVAGKQPSYALGGANGGDDVTHASLRGRRLGRVLEEMRRRLRKEERA